MNQKDWDAILRRDPCTYCDAPAAEVDHIDGLHGERGDTNKTGACRHCNRSKGCKSFLAFISGLDFGPEHQTTRLRRRLGGTYTLQRTY